MAKNDGDELFFFSAIIKGAIGIIFKRYSLQLSKDKKHSDGYLLESARQKREEGEETTEEKTRFFS